MPDSSTNRTRVWDLPTRLFHWLLVLLIICAWISFQYSDVFGDDDLLWHRFNGYAILVLLLWRLIWGVAGPPAVRFTNFLAWPWTAAGYGLDLIRGRERHYLGHNPLGSYMILALLALVGAQGILGLFATEHNFVTWGPLSNLISEELSETLTKYHVWMFEGVILYFIGAHIAANVIYRLVKKDQLIEAMVVGSKPAGKYEDDAVALDDQVAKPATIMLRALLCLALAVALFAGAIVGVGGKLIN